MSAFFTTDSSWLRAAIVFAAALLMGLAGHWLLFFILRRVAVRTASIVDDAVVKYCRGASRMLLVLVVLLIFLPLALLPMPALSFVQQVLSMLLITAVAWLVVKLTYVGEDLLVSRYDVDVADNLQARKIHTQYGVLKRVVIAATCVIALACILMTFDRVRQVGAGILASAGIVGLVLGFAAQKTIGTLFAGFQIAITQPIRIDDVVVVEGEWGRIEEITLTFVVVRIWDQRRLVLPITYFIDKPFQNWTRVSADLLGTVFLYVDHTVPVDDIRQKLERIVTADERWDQRVCSLAVTNISERTVEIRALISAADSGKAWDMRCEVREKLIAFIRDHYPQVLPRIRAEIKDGIATPGKSQD